jgi:hypothetical protein
MDCAWGGGNRKGRTGNGGRIRNWQTTIATLISSIYIYIYKFFCPYRVLGPARHDYRLVVLRGQALLLSKHDTVQSEIISCHAGPKKLAQSTIDLGPCRHGLTFSSSSIDVEVSMQRRRHKARQTTH